MLFCSLLRRSLTLNPIPILTSTFCRMPPSPSATFSTSITFCRMPPSPSATFSTSTTSCSSLRPLRGVVFDMDGTLTVPVIDFDAMYRGVLGDEPYERLRSLDPSGSIDILHHIDSWSCPDRRAKAFRVIAHFEKLGMDRLQIMPGAVDLCGFLDSNRIRRGLITRNVKAAVDLFHHRFGIEFSPALSREFRPYKPDPAPLLHICSTWDLHPSEVMMVGDSLKDDVVCGKRAGAITCLYDETGRYGPIESLGEDVTPDFKVSSLPEVCSLLEKYFELSPRFESTRTVDMQSPK